MDYFSLYELPRSFHPDPALVKKHYYALSRQYHPDRYANATPAEQAHALKMAAQNNAAWKTLSHPDSTMAYLLKLEGVLEDGEKYSLPPAFLMEIMELNEAIGNASMAPDMLLDALREFETASADWEREVNGLTTRYEAGDRSAALLEAVKDFYFRKKYLLRLKEQIENLARV